MPRPMKRIVRLLASIAVFAVLLSACTGDGGREPNDGTTGDATAGQTGAATGETSLEPVDASGASATSATYEYLNAGLEVRMRIDGETGTMEIDNGTDHDVGKPSFYILDATTGTPSDGRVQSGAPVAAGDTASFDVSLEGTRIADIGLVVLMLGRDNYGAFVRTA